MFTSECEPWRALLPTARFLYLYDGLNRRVKKDLDTGDDVVYLYTGWQCIEERIDDSGTWEARGQYVHGARYMDELLLFDKDTNDDGDCTDGGGSTRHIYCQDANFNVVALTDNVGVIVEKTWYEAYGKPTWYYSSSEQTSSSVANPYLFQGRRYDSETGLYYFRYRDMSPTLGRFLQRDPIGYRGGLNLHQCLGSAPTFFVDPWGLKENAYDCCTDWETMWVIQGYVSPWACAADIIGQTWWGSIPITLGAAGGTIVVDTTIAATGYGAGILTTATPAGLGALTVGTLGYRRALVTCTRYHCTYREASTRTVIKKGWIWDCVKYECSGRGVLVYSAGRDLPTYDEVPTGPKVLIVWER